MRNSKTHSITMKKKLIKCQTVFNAYNDSYLSRCFAIEQNTFYVYWIDFNDLF